MDDCCMPKEFRIRRRTRLPADERREQILNSATAAIAARGFWGLSLQDVADSCELTVNGVLHHVGSKQGLLIAILDRRDFDDAKALASLLGVESTETWTPDDLAQTAAKRGVGLAAMCNAVVARNSTQPEIVRLYSVLEAESLSPDHPAHEYFANRQRVALAGFARLAPPTANGPSLARHLLAVMDGLQLQWLRDPRSDLLKMWESAVAEMANVS